MRFEVIFRKIFWAIGVVDTGSSFSYKDRDCGYAQVAQLVEHSTENAGVGCSNQPLGTTFPPLFTKG